MFQGFDRIKIVKLVTGQFDLHWVLFSEAAYPFILLENIGFSTWYYGYYIHIRIYIFIFIFKCHIYLFIYIYYIPNNWQFVQLVELVLLIAILCWYVFIILSPGLVHQLLAPRTWPPGDVLGLLGIGVGPADWLNCIWKDEISQLTLKILGSMASMVTNLIKKYREVKKPMCFS